MGICYSKPPQASTGKKYDDDSDIEDEERMDLVYQSVRPTRKHDPSIAPTVKRLASVHLPEPPTDGTQVREALLRSTVVEALSALLSPKQLKHLGSLAVALCNETSDRIISLKKNKEVPSEAARALGEKAQQVAQNGKTVTFNLTPSNSEGIEEAEELIEHTFSAFRLVIEATRKGGKGVILRLLNCRDLAAGVEEVKQRLIVAASLANLIFNSPNSEKDSPPQLLQSCKTEDAADFWHENGFGDLEIVSLNTLLLAIDAWVREDNDLQLISSDEGIYFDLASCHNYETVSLDRFLDFLGSASLITDAVRDCMNRDEYLDSLDDNNDSSPTGSKETLEKPAADKIMNKHYFGLLQNALQPLSFGDDFVQHQKTYIEGTLAWVFHEFEKWAAFPPGKEDRRVLWIKGGPGIGKSAIAAELVRKYGTRIQEGGRASPSGAQPLIAAHFFCKSSDASRNNPRKAISTVAFRMASRERAYAMQMRTLLENEIKRRMLRACASGSEGTVEETFDMLIGDPFRAAMKRRGAGAGDVLILVDGLDELVPGVTRQQILQLFGRQLLSLPSFVRLVVTSQETKDIGMFLKRYRPYVLDVHQQSHENDLKIYLQSVILPSVGVSIPDDNDTLVSSIIDQVGGSFLALRLVHTVLQEAAANGSLTLSQVEEVLAKHGHQLIDFIYKSILDRIQTQLEEASGGDSELLLMLQTVLQHILAVLVISKEPLRLNDLHKLCCGVRIQSKALTKRLVRMLSPLFSALNKHSGIEPLHQSVKEFLVDPNRAGNHVVDIRLGHATLATSLLTVLQENELLEAPWELISPDRIHDNLLHYALKYAHKHLGQCMMALVEPSASGEADYGWKNLAQLALQQWASTFICSRTAEKKAIVAPKSHQPSSTQTSIAFGAWMLLQTHTMQRKRVLVGEFTALSEAGQQLRAIGEITDSTVMLFFELLRDLQLLYGAHWAPCSTVKDGVEMMAPHIPVTSQLYHSKGWLTIGAISGSSRLTASLPVSIALRPCLNTMVGHSGFVFSVAFSPDGERIVSSSSDKTVKLWDTASGETINTLKAHTGYVWSVTFSPDGQYIASGSDDKLVILWDAAVGAPLHNLEGHSGSVRSVAFSPDSSLLVSGNSDKTIKLWEVDTGAVVNTFEGHSDWVTSVAFHPGGQHIVSSSYDRTVRVWNTITGETENTLEGHAGFVTCVVYSRDGERIISGSDDMTIKIWNPIEGTLLLSIDADEAFVTSIALSYDNRYIVSGSHDATIKVWDAATGNRVNLFEGHRDYVLSIAFSPDGKRIVSSSDDKTVKVWDAESDGKITTLDGHTAPVCSVVTTADGSAIISGGEDRSIRVWESATGESFKTMYGHDDAVVSVALNSAADRITSGSRDMTVKIWDFKTNSILFNLEGHTGGINFVTYSKDDNIIASASKDKTVRLWNAISGECLHVLEGHDAWVTSVAFSIDCQRVVSGSDDKTLMIWDVSSGETLQIFNGHSNNIKTATFSPDNVHIASGDDGNNILIWNSTTCETVYSLLGHQGAIRSLIYTVDGRYLISGSEDRAVIVWNTISGDMVNKLQGHGEAVTSVCISADAKKIVSASDDLSVKIWDAAPRETIKTLEGHKDWVACVTYSKDGKYIASCADDQAILIWDTVNGKIAQRVSGHKGSIRSVAISHDSKKLASCGSDQTVKLWDLQTSQLIRTFEGHHSSVTSVAFSPDGKFLVSGSRDFAVKVWDVEKGKIFHSLYEHLGRIFSVQFSPDGKTFLSSSHDNMVKIWDTHTGDVIHCLEGHSGRVWTATFSPDGATVASGSSDKTVRLWDTTTGKLCSTFGGDGGAVTAVAFFRDGRYIVSGSDDKLVKLWNTLTGELVMIFDDHRGFITSIDVSPDGKWIVTGSGDKTLKVWTPAVF